MLQAAIAESSTEVSENYNADVVLTFHLAHALTLAGRWADAVGAWLWLAPRAACLPNGGPYAQWRDGFTCKYQAVHSLMDLGLHAEALQVAQDGLVDSKRTYGDGAYRTMFALTTLLLCNDEVHALPRPTLIAMLQEQLEAFRRVHKDAIGEIMGRGGRRGASHSASQSSQGDSQSSQRTREGIRQGGGESSQGVSRSVSQGTSQDASLGTSESSQGASDSSQAASQVDSQDSQDSQNSQSGQPGHSQDSQDTSQSAQDTSLTPEERSTILRTLYECLKRLQLYLQAEGDYAAAAKASRELMLVTRVYLDENHINRYQVCEAHGMASHHIACAVYA